MSHNQFLLGIVIPSKKKGSSNLTAVYTTALHSRPVLGPHLVLALPTNLSCMIVQPLISSQQHSLSLHHCLL